MWFVNIQHNTKSYLDVVVNQYINHPPLINFPEVEISKFIKAPKVQQVEIHHFGQRNTASLSIDGEFLCFVTHVILLVESADSETHEYKFGVNQQELVSSQSIQLQEKEINLPAEFEKFCSQSTHGDYKELVERAYISLQTHYGSFHSDKKVKVKHKVKSV